MSVQVTLMGVCSEPTLRFTQAGKAVLSFSLVTKRSQLNVDTGRWEDHEETWWQVTAWEKLAENCAESLAKGLPVIVVGRTYQDTYVKDGKERTSMKVSATAIGPDLRRTTAKVRKVEREKANDAVVDADPWTKPKTDDVPPF
jgi:single-strand DNA-binding protein